MASQGSKGKRASDNILDAANLALQACDFALGIAAAVSSTTAIPGLPIAIKGLHMLVTTIQVCSFNPFLYDSRLTFSSCLPDR